METLFHPYTRTFCTQTFALSKVRTLISSISFPLERKLLRIIPAVRVKDNQYSEMHLGNLGLINFEWSEMWKLHCQSEQGLRAGFSKANLHLRVPDEGLTHWSFHLRGNLSFTTFLFLQMKKKKVCFRYKCPCCKKAGYIVFSLFSPDWDTVFNSHFLMDPASHNHHCGIYVEPFQR